MSRRYMHKLSDNPDVLQACNRFIDEMKANRIIRQDREPLNGNESAIAEVTGDHIDGVVVHWQPNDHLIWVDLIYVAPGKRYKGIGTGLLNELVMLAPTHFVTTVQFGTHYFNEAMRTVADKAGFKIDHIVMSQDVSAE